MPSKSAGTPSSKSAGGRSAKPQSGAGAGKGTGGAKQINRISKTNAATGKGSKQPPRGSPRGQ
jgi:hypothetical protein